MIKKKVNLNFHRLKWFYIIERNMQYCCLYCYLTMIGYQSITKSCSWSNTKLKIIMIIIIFFFMIEYVNCHFVHTSINVRKKLKWLKYFWNIIVHSFFLSYRCCIVTKYLWLLNIWFCHWQCYLNDV